MDRTAFRVIRFQQLPADKVCLMNPMEDIEVEMHGAEAFHRCVSFNYVFFSFLQTMAVLKLIQIRTPRLLKNLNQRPFDYFMKKVFQMMMSDRHDQLLTQIQRPYSLMIITVLHTLLPIYLTMNRQKFKNKYLNQKITNQLICLLMMIQMMMAHIHQL